MTIRQIGSRCGKTGLALLLTLACTTRFVPATEPAVKNVLMIAIDDLRPQLNCYGQTQMISPNIDALAAAGYQFNRAYIQQAVCSPSRTSIMTGMRPDSTRVYDLNTHFRDTIPWVETLPQYLIRHGYYSAGIGKIFHGSYNDTLTWSEPWVSGGGTQYVISSNKTNKAAVENEDVADNVYKDGAVAEAAITKLADLKNKQPFFYGVGFRKPHLPFTSPKTYSDLYTTGDLDIPYTRVHAQDAASYAYTSWGELRSYYGMPASGPVSLDQEKELIHGYYACVSYVDKLIGDLLAALEAQGLADNTIVFLWGDHGWHLGNQDQWTKHTCFERATHIPMIIKVPWMPGGEQLNQLTEAVDLYPTIVELCGLPLPSHLEGESLKPILENPALPGKAMAISQYPRSGAMGYSMRTDRYRYTEWRAKNSNLLLERELYDHNNDPGEDTNVVSHAGNETTVSNLAVQLETRLNELKPANGGLSVQLVSNGEFDDGFNGWELKTSGLDTSFEALPTDGAGGLGDDPLAHASITNGGTSIYKLALEQIIPGTSADNIYTIRLRARAAADRDIRILWRNKNNSTNSYLSITVPISTTAQLYEFSNIRLSYLSGTDPDGELRLQMGGDTNDVWLDSVEIYAQESLSTVLLKEGLTGLDAMVDADSDGDNVPNLFEYACNMDFGLSDWHFVTQGTGTSGLPFIEMSQTNDTDALTIEFLRRRTAYDLQYLPEFCSDLMSNGWSRSTLPETVLPIDDAWERVIIRDHETPASQSSRFGRVRVLFDP